MTDIRYASGLRPTPEPDDLTLPDFLDRKINGIAPATPEEIRMAKRMRSEPKIIWPKKRNWRKIEERRRRREKREEMALTKGCFKARRGQ